MDPVRTSGGAGDAEQPEPGEMPDGDRLTRNVGELLQEILVAQAGVQILFGFLLSVTFTSVYQDATTFQHVVHLTTVMLAVGATALLTAPAAWHRLLFRRGRREEIVRRSNVFSLAGLALLAAAITGTVLLLTDVVPGDAVAAVLTTATAAMFAFLWFAWPLRSRVT